MDDENRGGCLITFLILTTVLFTCLFFFFARVNPDGKPGLVIGKPPAVESPEAIQAKAAGEALVIQAQANAKTQATDDTIKLAWNKHLMRRWWFVASIPAAVVFIGLGAYLYFWVRGR